MKNHKRNEEFAETARNDDDEGCLAALSGELKEVNGQYANLRTVGDFKRELRELVKEFKKDASLASSSVPSAKLLEIMYEARRKFSPDIAKMLEDYAFSLNWG